MFPPDVEQTIVHELLHIYFAELDNSTNGSVKNILWEQRVDFLADLLVGLKRSEERGLT